MAYHLAIDLGTTYTAAAVRHSGRSEIVTLGNRSAVIPSVIFLREDETILVGDAANRRALTEPGRVAREFKRRIGDGENRGSKIDSNGIQIIFITIQLNMVM